MRGLRGFCAKRPDPLGWNVYRQPLPEQRVDNRKVELDYHSTEPGNYFDKPSAYSDLSLKPGEEGPAAPQIYYDRTRKFSEEYRPWMVGHFGQGFFFVVYALCWAYLFVYLRNEQQRRGKPRDLGAEFVN